VGRQPTFHRSLSGFDPRRTPVLRTDVLVVGAGIAGCAAALSAAEAGADVLVLSKTPLEESNTSYAQGGMAAVLDAADSIELHLEDTLRVGAGLTDAEVARSIIAQSADVVEWFERIGARFDRGESGALLLSREGGHSINRVIHAHGAATGAEIQRALKAAVTDPRKSITVRTNAFVRDLLTLEGRCVGCVAVLDGVELGIDAGAVIVATGGAGQVYRETTNPIGACGDGLAMCLRAGAELADMEFVQFHPTTLYIAGAARFLISEAVRGAGAVLRDRDGVRFMQDVHPAGELAPRDVVSRAILQRMVATGDTHMYLDVSGLDGDPRKLFPSIARICNAFDIDIAKDAIPVRPGAHYVVGGVRSDLLGHSNVPGLFVAGEAAATGFHGANRMASNSLLEGAVLGRRAGQEGAAHARSAERVALQAVAGAPAADNAPRLQLDDMLYSLKSLMWRQVGLLRNGEGLDEAVARIALWHHYLLRAQPRSQQACELSNMLTVSAMVATAALRREESRGTHYRTDHPDRDELAWCRRIRQRLAPDGTIDIALGPVLQPTDGAIA
jgi:L-aspartate oxidase